MKTKLIECTTCCGNGWLIAYIDEHVFPERCETCGGLGEIEDSQYEEAMDLKYMERMGK